jgi:hypothetical protein
MALEIVGAEEFDDIGAEAEGDDFEVGGEDLEGLLGYAPRRRAVRRGPPPRRSTQTPARHRPLAVAQSGRNDARELILGFIYLAVPAGSSVVVAARPQVLFRGTRLVIAASCAPSFSVDDIKVGNRSQYVAAGPVPAEAFTQNAVNTPLSIDTCQVSMEIILQVSNFSLAACDFRAGMFGDAIY